MENLVREFGELGQIMTIAATNDKFLSLVDNKGKNYKVSFNVLNTYKHVINGEKIMINEFYLLSNNMICKFDAFMFFLNKNLDRFKLDKELLSKFVSEQEDNKYKWSKVEEDFCLNVLSFLAEFILIETKKEINFNKFNAEIRNLFENKKEYKIYDNLDLLTGIIVRQFSLNVSDNDSFEIMQDCIKVKRSFNLQYYIKELFKKNKKVF